MRTLIEVDSFDADVDVPEDGDARTSASVDNAFQALANRGKYLNARRVELAARITALEDKSQTAAVYRVSGTGLSDGDLLTYIATTLNTGFTLVDSDQKIQVPSAGVYRVAFKGFGELSSAISDDADDTYVKPQVGAAGVGADFYMHGLKTLIGVRFQYIGEILLPVTDPGADLISNKFIIDAHTSRTVTFTGSLMLEKTGIALP